VDGGREAAGDESMFLTDKAAEERERDREKRDDTHIHSTPTNIWWHLPIFVTI
jgi:hypothetical protein